MNERGRGISDLKREQIMDETSSAIEADVRNFAEAQQAIEEALEGGSVLVVDSLLGRLDRYMEKSVQMLHEQGWADLAALLLQKMFEGRIPNGKEIFQRFLGPGADVSCLDIRDAHTRDLSRDIRALIFSGSPANVTDALRTPEAEVHDSGGVTHGYVFDTATALYRQANDAHIPVLGICYGHQMISQNRGSEVYRLPARYREITDVTPTAYGASLIAGVFGAPLRSGKIDARHGDAVHHDAARSALLMSISDAEPGVVHGLLHLPEGVNAGALTGESEHDAQLIRELLNCNAGVALSVQGHPEFPHGFFEFSEKADPAIFATQAPEMLGSDYLNMFAAFIRASKKK